MRSGAWGETAVKGQGDDPRRLDGVAHQHIDGSACSRQMASDQRHCHGMAKHRRQAAARDRAHGGARHDDGAALAGGTLRVEGEADANRGRGVCLHPGEFLAARK